MFRIKIEVSFFTTALCILIWAIRLELGDTVKEVKTMLKLILVRSDETVVRTTSQYETHVAQVSNVSVNRGVNDNTSVTKSP